MNLILVLLAGGIIGVWHERDKAKAARKAFREGEAHARQRARDHRVYAQQPRQAVPVPIYSDAKHNYVPAYLRRARVNEIATQAVTLGKAVGRVQ